MHNVIATLPLDIAQDMRGGVQSQPVQAVTDAFNAFGRLPSWVQPVATPQDPAYCELQLSYDAGSAQKYQQLKAALKPLGVGFRYPDAKAGG